MAQDRIEIESGWGTVTATLADNAATGAFVSMLPLTIAMRDHRRQEKTGALPHGLPAVTREVEFAKGTLGLWGTDDFVIYYKAGPVPQPGIIILGNVQGDVSIFDRPGTVAVDIHLIS